MINREGAAALPYGKIVIIIVGEGRRALPHSLTMFMNIFEICSCPFGFGWMQVRSNQVSDLGW